MHLVHLSLRAVNIISDKVLYCSYIGLPISGIEDDAGVELDSSFSSRKKARNRFIPAAGHGQNAATYLLQVQHTSQVQIMNSSAVLCHCTDRTDI